MVCSFLLKNTGEGIIWHYFQTAPLIMHTFSDSNSIHAHCIVMKNMSSTCIINTYMCETVQKSLPKFSLGDMSRRVG